MIDLFPFCHKDGCLRPQITKPFNRGKFCYATDGSIIIRVDARDGTEYEAHDKAPTIVGIEAVMRGTFDDPIPMPSFDRWEDHEEPCTNCNHGVCKHCDNGDCEKCDGTGVIIAKSPSVYLLHVALSAKYLTMISDLPGALIHLNSDHSKPMVCKFTFDGGEGRLMPMRINE